MRIFFRDVTQSRVTIKLFILFAPFVFLREEVAVTEKSIKGEEEEEKLEHQFTEMEAEEEEEDENVRLDLAGQEAENDDYSAKNQVGIRFH